MEAKDNLKISVEVNIAYNMVNALMLFLRDAEARMANNKDSVQRESKKAFTRLTEDVKRVIRSEAVFDEAIFAAFHGDFSRYQDWQRDYNDLARLILLYVDRCDDNEANRTALFETLEGMIGAELFSDADIARFRLKE